MFHYIGNTIFISHIACSFHAAIHTVTYIKAALKFADRGAHNVSNKHVVNNYLTLT